MSVFLKGGFLTLVFGLPLGSLYFLVAHSCFGAGHLVSRGGLGESVWIVMLPVAGGFTALLTERVGMKLSSIWIRLLLGGGFGALLLNLATLFLRFDTQAICPCGGGWNHNDWLSESEPVRTTWVFVAALATGLTCGAFVAAWTYRGERKDPLLSHGSVTTIFLGCLAMSWVGYALFWEIFPPHRMIQP